MVNPDGMGVLSLRRVSERFKKGGVLMNNELASNMTEDVPPSVGAGNGKPRGCACVA